MDKIERKDFEFCLNFKEGKKVCFSNLIRYKWKNYMK